jgi:hypothetical protein
MHGTHRYRSLQLLLLLLLLLHAMHTYKLSCRDSTAAAASCKAVAACLGRANHAYAHGALA